MREAYLALDYLQIVFQLPLLLLAHLRLDRLDLNQGAVAAQ
jgi:hypothetical protein